MPDLLDRARHAAVIIPALNEAGNIRKLGAQIGRIVAAQAMVDDNSSTGSTGAEAVVFLDGDLSFLSALAAIGVDARAGWACDLCLARAGLATSRRAPYPRRNALRSALTGLTYGTICPRDENPG